MKKNVHFIRDIIVLITFLLLINVQFIESQCTILSKGTEIASLDQQYSWGQSFIPSCSKDLKFIVFNSATAVNSTFTLTLRNGTDCNASIILRQTIPQIIDGENKVDFVTPISVLGGSTYYFSVESNANTAWKVRFSPTTQVPGNMRTHLGSSPKTACDFNFQDFDWAFSVDTIGVPPAAPRFPELGKDVDLFILAGQSNAQGWQGDGAYYPNDSSNSDQFIGLNYIFINNTSSLGNWITMQPQNGRFTKGHFGPEVSFSRKLKEAGFNPAIFKFTLGGTSIYSDWRTPGAKGYYDNMVIELKKAILVLEQKGYTVTIRGFIWIQGESDANATAAPLYYSSLLSIIKDLRTNVVKRNDLPVILGVDEQHPDMLKYPIIVDSQKRIAAEIGNCVYTSMYGLPKADVTHLTPAGLVTHGIRIFDAFKSLNISANMTEVMKMGYKLNVKDNKLFVYSDNGQFELSVFDDSGRLVASKSSRNGKVEFHLNKGFTIAKVTMNGKQSVTKIIN